MSQVQKDQASDAAMTNYGAQAGTRLENQGIWGSLVDGVRYLVSDVLPSTWMSPNQPLAPIEQQERGRAWDYPVGYNTWIQPRSNSPIGFATMRGMADGYDLLRTLIENKKDQLMQLEWVIQRTDGKKSAENDARIKEITAFFRFPDKVNPWKTWLRAAMEDMLVIDALTIYPRMTRGGKVYSLDLIDGATIKPVITAEGRRPLPPDVAYQQVIKGVPMADYAADQLVYFPRNVRTNRVYGYSPVEQIIMTVNIALRRQIYQLEYYTSGSVPDTLIALPEGWSPEQIAMFDQYWQSILSGQTAVRRQAKFIPNGSLIHDTRAATLKDDYDEWLARVCCFAFGTSPQPFIKMMNRATAETLKESANEEGVRPWTITVKDLMDLMIWTYWGYDDLEFAWKPSIEGDPVKRAQADDYDIRNGARSVDEVRTDRKLEPIGMSNAVYTAAGPQLLQPIIDGAPDAAQAGAATIATDQGQEVKAAQTGPVQK